MDVKDYPTIQKFMRLLDISEAEAKQLILDDKADNITPEGEKLQERAKKNKVRNIVREVKRDADRPQQKKDKPPDAGKDGLIKALTNAIDGLDGYRVETVIKSNEIDFNFDGFTYTIKITKHKKGWIRK